MEVVQIKTQGRISPVDPDRVEAEFGKLNPKLSSRLRRLLAEVIAFVCQVEEKMEPTSGKYPEGPK